MESEKVKEIKKALECCINDCSGNSCPYDKYEKGLKCIDDLQKDALTLINELESENELLRNAKVVYENVDYCAEDLKKAQDQIAELEKENAETMKAWFEDREGMFWDGVGEGELKGYKQLKQFAERLKEKLNDIFSTPELDLIDEALKEFI